MRADDEPRGARRPGLTRRELFQVAGGAGLAALLGVAGRTELQEFDATTDPLRAYGYRSWEDLYRGQATWDRVVRSTHSANCTGSCSWKVYVKDGVMLREEQAADYPSISSELPDYNPRGCQKGGCYVEYVYGAQRVRYPLMRVGERGEGKWKRVSWDEALTYIAGKVLDNIYEHGPDTNTFFSVIPAMSPVSFSAGARLAHYLGGVFCSFYDWYCDLPPGEPITWGVQTESCECADWFNSKYIVLWGSNINETRIPDAHFAWEARYNGARVVCVSPDYNSSAIHSDLHLAVNPGTDAVLALGACRHIIDSGAYDEAYVKQQTDMPLLVRLDNRRLLRVGDLSGFAAEDPDAAFLCWDISTGGPAPLPGCMGSADKTLDLGAVGPALSGRWTVTLASGEECEVTTVFERLRQSLQDPLYSLEGASERCGLDPADVARFWSDFATRRPAMIIHGAGTNHWYHNDLLNRAMILIVALTGNVGRNGGGFNHYVGQERVWPEHGFKLLAFPQGAAKQRFQNTTLWTYCHSAQEDPHLVGGQTSEYWVAESVKRGWMPLWPKQDEADLVPERMHSLPRKPRALFVWRANYLNQAKGNEAILRSLWRDLDLIVNVNFRMDTTALYSDVVLPAASYYEKTDLNCTDCHSFMHPFSKVLDPLFESKTDWDVFAALARKISDVARERGLRPYDDTPLEWSRDFTRLYEEWSAGGKLESDEAACDAILSDSAETQGMTYRSIQAAPTRFVDTDPEVWNSPVEPGRAYTPFLFQTEQLKPWRTLTGRQQFYIDQEWFLRFGEELPVHKEPQEDLELPLYWNTPHGRWSIHSTWRDNRYMLRLQRGLPIVYLSTEEAARHGIEDNDWVRITSLAGSMVAKAKLRPGEKPGRLTMYHGWERYLGFQAGGWQSLTYIKIKPTQLVGGYGHLRFRLNYWGPTGNNRDIRVRLEKYEGPVAPWEGIVETDVSGPDA